MLRAGLIFFAAPEPRWPFRGPVPAHNPGQCYVNLPCWTPAGLRRAQRRQNRQEIPADSAGHFQASAGASSTHQPCEPIRGPHLCLRRRVRLQLFTLASQQGLLGVLSFTAISAHICGGLREGVYTCVNFSTAQHTIVTGAIYTTANRWAARVAAFRHGRRPRMRTRARPYTHTRA